MNLLLAHILRGLQFVFAIVTLGLGADACTDWGFYSPSQTSFIVFCAVWTILAVCYFMLSPRFFKPAAHPIALFVVDALTMLFWFAGFIALAVLVNYEGHFVAPAGTINYGYYWASGHWYQVAAAATAFGAAEWALFVATTVILGLEVFNKGRGPTNKGAANPEVSTTNV